MRLTDPVADMLARIRNAYMVKHSEVSMPYSKLKEGIVKIFCEEGYALKYRLVTEGSKKHLVLSLKYTDTGDSVIRGIKMVSKPGRRVYINTKNMAPVLGGLGNGIVSTSSGLKTVKRCIHERVGGEYICQIW